MSKEFKMPYDRAKRPDEFTRPAMPEWLVSASKELRTAGTSARKTYRYWLKLYWATPPWLSDAQIDAMRELYLRTNSLQNVDHIVPLKGKYVCGLHVPWNLERVSIQENLNKSNSIWPDAPFAVEDMFGGDVEPVQLSLF